MSPDVSQCLPSTPNDSNSRSLLPNSTPKGKKPAKGKAAAAPAKGAKGKAAAPAAKGGAKKGGAAKKSGGGGRIEDMDRDVAIKVGSPFTL